MKITLIVRFGFGGRDEEGMGQMTTCERK